MADLYSTNGNAIAMGNARRDAVRSFNEQVKSHNDDVANQISGLRDQERSADTVASMKATGQAMWTGSDMPNRIKSFNDYMAKPSTGNPVANAIETAKSKVSTIADDAQTKLSTAIPSEGIAEGSVTGDTIGEQISRVTGGGGKSMLADGLKSSEGIAESGAKKLGAVAGVFGETAQGGLDIYDDIKAGGIAGNNNWEKAGNVMQIGGSVADIVGTVFPPAKLLGGILDLASAGVNQIGGAEDSSKVSSDLTARQSAETQQTMSAPASQTITTGRVQ